MIIAHVHELIHVESAMPNDASQDWWQVTIGAGKDAGFYHKANIWA